MGRPYNTIKNEIKRGTVSLYNGKQHRYKADEGKKVYLEHRRNCRKQYRYMTSVRFLQYVVAHFKSEDKWSLDASYGKALADGKFRREEMVCTKTLYNYVDLGLLPIKNIDLPEKLRRNTKAKKARENKKILGRSMLENYKNTLGGMVGPTKVMVSGNTLQVKDYGKYGWTMFDPEAKKARHEEVFPKELEKAFSLGAEIVKEPWES